MYYIMKLTNIDARFFVIVNGLTMWATFLVCRILVNPAIVLCGYLSLRPDILALSPVMIPAMFLLSGVLQVINMFWFYKVRCLHLAVRILFFQLC
jgi:hypothetical protein